MLNVSPETVGMLARIVDDSRRELPALDSESFLLRAMDLLPASLRAVDLHLPTRLLRPLGLHVESRFGIAGRTVFARALVASLAIRQSEMLSVARLPSSILELYPVVFDRLARYLMTEAGSSYWIGNDAFLKDLRIAAGYSVPCGAQDVDLISTIRKTAGLKAILKWRALKEGWIVLRDGGPPWFSIHTDQRYTDEFHEAGWDRCYRRIAEMLVLHPDIKGMVGTSWFYDPQIKNVSPRLAYLQINPVRRGAFLLPHGPGKIHTERATLKSESRRRLYEQGKYMPVCYSLVWHRRSLIAWATGEQ